MQEPRTSLITTMFVDDQEVGRIEAIDVKGLEEQMYKLEKVYNQYLNGEYDDYFCEVKGFFGGSK